MAIATLAAHGRARRPFLLTAGARSRADLSARAAEVERLGSLPADLLEPLRQAGLFRLLQPRALGGLELDPAASSSSSKKSRAPMVRPVGRS